MTPYGATGPQWVYYMYIILWHCIDHIIHCRRLPNNEMYQFQHVAIINMEIYHIEEMAFAGFHDLRTLTLKHTGLTSMPSINPVKRNLERLVLEYNNISVVPPGYFSAFKTLKYLCMYSNRLHLVPDISALHNTMIYVHLGENNIHSISHSLNGTIYPLVQFLDLSSNAIKTFDPAMLSLWPSLQVLNLRHNRIFHLPTSYPESRRKQCLYKITPSCFLYYGGNPIHCDKAVEELITRRRDGYYFVNWNCHIKIGALRETVCVSPPQLCGQNLVQLGEYNTDTWSICLS